jgi:hypothetical protein
MEKLIDDSIDKLLKENSEILTLRITSLMEIVKYYHSYKTKKVGVTNIKIDNKLLKKEHDRWFKESYLKLF